MVKITRNNRTPDTMTGGVDLTGSVDITDDAPDSLTGLNAQPDVIQTLTGIRPLSPDVHLEQPHDDGQPFQTDPTITRGLHEVATRFDGEPVRVVPASRFRTLRIPVAPGTQIALAARDARRIRAVVLLTSVTATDVGYVSNDQTTAALMGFALPINVPVEFRHGDEIGFATPATNNALGAFISIAFEIQE